MSFGLLTPLYLIGLTAISLPILFHLIRRTPRGQTMFSSLMFLSPSPPRLTRRSRIDNWLLLLLRAIALLLIALAFARPFRRSQDNRPLSASSERRIAIVVDRSASMRRDGLWDKVEAEIGKVLDDVGVRDEVAFFAFDDDVESLLSFEDASKLDPKHQVAAVRLQWNELQPTWGGTDLGAALIAVADNLDALRAGKESDVEARSQIILISDFQSGSKIESLQGYQWPKHVQVEVRAVGPSSRGNAAVHLIADRESPDASRQRLRISNSSDAVSEQFSVGWKGETPVSVYVPPGRQKVIKVPERSNPGAIEIQLRGDKEDFDNKLFFSPIRQQLLDIVYIGNDEPRDTGGLLFYLNRVFYETPNRKVTIRQVKLDGSLDALTQPQVKLVVLAGAVDESRVRQLRKFVAGGAHVLTVVTKPEMGASIAGLTGIDVSFSEAEVPDYQLFGSIDFQHAVFAPLLTAKFTDFTQPHFWHFRKTQFKDKMPESVRVLARFDTDDPALLEFRVEQGRVMLFTSGWQPDDSQLALSKKFAPLISLFLQYAVGGFDHVQQYSVGDRVRLSDAAKVDPTVRTPDQQVKKIAADATHFAETEKVGVYQLKQDGKIRHFAVNLVSRESDTVALDVEVLERRGVALGRQETRAEETTRSRQKRDKELEKSQQLWRWIIIAAIAVLVLETALGGVVLRKNQQAASSAYAEGSS